MRRTSRLRMAGHGIAVLLLAWSLLPAADARADPCAGVAAGGVFNVRQARNELWADTSPSSLSDIQALNESARALERSTRGAVMDCVSQRVSAQNHRPARPSGTPAHAEGSSGLLTDIDDAYDSLDDARAAAAEYEKLGYSVKWDTPNSFSVDELDYVGFSMEDPQFPPGSAEADNALRQALRNEDQVKTVGGQQWVEGKVQPKARIDTLQDERNRIASELGRDDLPAARRQELTARMAAADDEIGTLRRQVEDFRLTDPEGFNADMLKKGTHHMDPSKWCPPQQAFHCYEEPRQAAKAAHRALSEAVPNPTPEQQALLDRLNDQAKKRRILPSDPAAFEAESARLQGDIRSAFGQATREASAAERRLNEELVEQYRAAQAAGDSEGLARVEARMAERREAARRTQVTLEELSQNDHLPHARQTLHEWTTGQRLRRVDRPGKPPIFEVIEDGPDGARVVGQLSEAEVGQTARNAIRRNAIRSQYHGPPFQTRPRFSTFEPRGPLSRAASEAGDLIRRGGLLGALGTAYSAYTGAEQSVEQLNRRTNLRIPGWSQIMAGEVGGEELAAWLAATGLGTVIGVADAVGVTAIEGAHGLGQGIYGLARRAELAAAQREGREASRLGVLARLNPAEVGRQFGEETAAALADWARGRATDIDAWRRADLEAIRAEIQANATQAALWARLADGGFEQVIGEVGRLRDLTDQLRHTWKVAASHVDTAILKRGDLDIHMGALGAPPDYAGRCRSLVATLGVAPDAAAVAAARSELQGLGAGYDERLRKAAISAFEARAAAVGAAGILGGGGPLAGLHQDQAALQASLLGRLNRLVTAAGPDPTLVALRDEVQSQGNPVAIGHAPGMIDAAQEVGAAAEAALQRLTALDTAAIPPCAFPEPLDPAVRVAGLAEGAAALERCDFEGIGAALAMLAPFEATLVESDAAILASLRREAGADAAYRASRPAYRSGDLAAAKAALDLASASSCTARQDEIQARRGKIEKLEGVLARADRVIAACDLNAIEVLRAKLVPLKHPLLKAKATGLADAKARCARTADAEPDDQPERKPERSAADGYVAAQSRCEAEAGEGAVAYKTGDGAFTCRCAKGYSKDASGRICVSEAQAARSGEDYCAANYRGGVLRGVRADGGYDCGCAEGTYADNEQGACLTWDEVVAGADAACKADGMVLAKVSGVNDYGCCPGDTHTYDEANDSCWSWDNLVADANAQCRQKGQVAAWINGVNDYLCCPAGTNRYDQSTNTCHNDAAAAQEFVQGLGTFLQGLGALSGALNQSRGGTGYGGNSGGDSCANPPPGCHCRPGSTELHCGSESGGSRKSAGSQRNSPAFTGCRWQRATIAGFGNRQGWACNCNEGEVTSQGAKYCGPKPN